MADPFSWATNIVGNPTFFQEPTQSKKDDGFRENIDPVFEQFNWAFHVLFSRSGADGTVFLLPRIALLEDENRKLKKDIKDLKERVTALENP